MKKFLIILIFIISFLCIPYYNNDYIDITHMINVSSVGLEKNNNTFLVYAYVIDNYTMSKSDFNTSSTSTPSTIISSSGNTIEQAFFNLYDSVFVNLNFSHIETLVLQNNFISNNNINELINFISTHNDFFPKFNIFITEENIKDVFNIKYFSDTSSYYNILTEYKSEIEHHPTTFIDLVNDFLEPNYFILYPSLKLNDNIIKSEKKGNSLFIDGYYYYDTGMLYKMNFSNYPLLYLLYSTNDISFEINNQQYFLYGYSLKTFRLKNKLFILFYSKSNYKYSLKKIVLENIINLYNKNVDVYNLKYFNIDLNNIRIISVEKKVYKY